MNKNMKSKIAIIFLLVTILLPFRSIAQSTTQAFIVQGGVTSKTDGEALIGVSVSEIDDNNRVLSATITDFNGHYVLKVKNPNNRLSVKIDEKILNELKDIRIHSNFKNETEVVKAIVLKINDDIVQEKDKKAMLFFQSVALAVA